MKKLLILSFGILTASNSFGFSKANVVNSVKTHYSKLAHSSVVLDAQTKASKLIATAQAQCPTIAKQALDKTKTGYNTLIQVVEKNPNATFSITLFTACAAIIVYNSYKNRDSILTTNKEDNDFYNSDECLFY